MSKRDLAMVLLGVFLAVAAQRWYALEKAASDNWLHIRAIEGFLSQAVR